MTIEKLTSSKDLAAFLKTWIEIHFSKSSLEQISKKCELSSKGFLHDILSGRRNPSLEVLQKLCKGLKIKGPEKKLLLNLWDGKKSDERLKILREKIILKDSKIETEKLPEVEGWDYVYSSLGPLNAGSTFEEIVQRAGMYPSKVKEVLDHLIAFGLVEFDETIKKYKAKAVHSVFEAGSNDEREYILNKVKLLQQSVPKKWDASSSLYRNFVFSVPQGSFPKLRERMRTLLNEFADEEESQTGSELVELFVAFDSKNSSVSR